MGHIVGARKADTPLPKRTNARFIVKLEESRHNTEIAADLGPPGIQPDGPLDKAIFSPISDFSIGPLGVQGPLVVAHIVSLDKHVGDEAVALLMRPSNHCIDRGIFNLREDVTGILWHFRMDTYIS